MEVKIWNKPTSKEREKLPKLYETERTAIQDKIIHMHFFIGGCDWYIAEFDGDDLFFCFAILHDDVENAEWGYVSLSEMEAINSHGLEIDRDMYWEPVPAYKIERVRKIITKQR